ncbi:hypothetical protein BY457_11129 [Marinilabilia salmonicolor]|jgi:hypothetical protein|nr:hypothetical protein BY457_11129 [Marinilabilia salmonicolor]
MVSQKRVLCIANVSQKPILNVFLNNNKRSAKTNKSRINSDVHAAFVFCFYLKIFFQSG